MFAETFIPPTAFAGEELLPALPRPEPLPVIAELPATARAQGWIMAFQTLRTVAPPPGEA